MAGGDKGLKFGLADTFRLAWADPDLRSRLTFIFIVFAVYALSIQVPVPIPGVNVEMLEALIKGNGLLDMMSMFGGRAIQKLSIVALGLGPYITASIIMQVMTTANPVWKKQLQEGGEHARKQQNQRIRLLTLGLCIAQGMGLMNMLAPAFGAVPVWAKATTIIFWTAGAMFLLWLGEQLTEKGIGNGVSLLIFAGIIIGFPMVFTQLYDATFKNRIVAPWQLVLVLALFLATTWAVVFFTLSQRRIPIQHSRRQSGTKTYGGQTSYLPLSVMMVGVIPIIFAYALLGIPAQLASMFPANSAAHNNIVSVAMFMTPNFTRWEGIIGALVFTALIFFFTYFYTAIQFNAEDISENLRQRQSFIPGVRPGKQTKEFIDGVITRVTIVGALFLALISLSTYFVPLILSVANVSLLFGTSLLIMVSVALETMRQIEANLLMKQYGQ